MTIALIPAEESALARLLPELLRLSPEARLEVVSQLVESMKAGSAQLSQAAASADVPPRTMLDFAGAWNERPESAEELIEQIRSARTFTRPDVSLD